MSWIVHAEQRSTRRRAWSKRDPRQLARLRQLESGLRHAERRSVHAEGGWVAACDGPLPCIDLIAAELRRLDRQRRQGPSTESTVWLAAVLFAYDEWLRLACRSLGLVEHLQPLQGLDRELERVRVESELQANGVTFRG